jgi:hypothetical protein
MIETTEDHSGMKSTSTLGNSVYAGNKHVIRKTFRPGALNDDGAIGDIYSTPFQAGVWSKFPAEALIPNA